MCRCYATFYFCYIDRCVAVFEIKIPACVLLLLPQPLFAYRLFRHVARKILEELEMGIPRRWGVS